MEIGDIICRYVVHKTSLSGVCMVLCNVGAIKCQPFLNIETTRNDTKNGTVHFGFCLASSLLIIALLLWRK